MPITRWPPCPGQSRSQGPALTPLDGTSPSGSFLPVVRAGSDHLKVVHPCGSRHGSQADRDPDWPLRPELAAPLGVWPSSQLAECAAGRRCWPLRGDVAVLPCRTVYRITSVFPCAAECSAVCQPKLRLCAGWRWGGAARVHRGQEILSCCDDPSDRGHDAGYGADAGLGGQVADRRPEGGQC